MTCWFSGERSLLFVLLVLFFHPDAHDFKVYVLSGLIVVNRSHNRECVTEALLILSDVNNI